MVVILNENKVKVTKMIKLLYCPNPPDGVGGFGQSARDKKNNYISSSIKDFFLFKLNFN